MIRRRRSLASTRKSERAPRARRKAPERERVDLDSASREEMAFVVPTTPEEKVDLILHHLERRRGKELHPRLRSWLVLAIVICVLVIGVGWWATFRVSLREDRAGSSSLWGIVQEGAGRFREDPDGSSQQFSEEWERYQAQKTAQEAALRAVAEEIRLGHATGSASSTQPRAASSTRTRVP